MSSRAGGGAERTIRGALWLVPGGLAIGWLTGLSASPVAATVLSSLLAIVAAVTSAIAGARAGAESAADESDEGKPAKPVDNGGKRLVTAASVSVAPVVFLVIGVSLGATMGVIARTRDWLSPAPKELVARWSNLGLDQADVTKHMLQRVEPVAAEEESSGEEKKGKTKKGEAKGGSSISSHSSVVWAGTAIDKCKFLENEKDGYDVAALQAKLNDIGTPFPGAIGAMLSKKQDLLDLVTIVCGRVGASTE